MLDCKTMPTLAGIISDTHGLLRPEALEALRGVRMIVHVGDIGAREVLQSLGEIAPVCAIRGNIDKAGWANRLPETRIMRIEQALIYVLHDVKQLDFDAAKQGYSAVISGHTHKALEEVRDGVLYLNPGSAGPRRFRLPVTLARMTVDGESIQSEIVTLDV